MSIKEINKKLREEKEKAVKAREELWHKNHPNGLFVINFIKYYSSIGLYHDSFPHNTKAVPWHKVTSSFHECSFQIKSQAAYDYTGERLNPVVINKSEGEGYWSPSIGKVFKFKTLEKFLEGCKKYNIPKSMVDSFLEKLSKE